MSLLSETMFVNSTMTTLPPVFESGLDLEHNMNCASRIRRFDPQLHKEKYKVGVHAIRGFEAAEQEYNMTFGEYLTETAGRRFDPPIEFEMVPMTFEGILESAESQDLDFFYANPSIYSCVGTEIGAQPLVTIIARLEVRGHTYDLDVFAGVIAARSDNDEINTLQDLKDKIIGAGSISMVMASQLQFYMMEKAGMSYVMDPKQVVFTGNQFDVVDGILDGSFDVGFVRTDQLERTTDENGLPVDPDRFKIIEPRIHVLDDGNLFPFLHSTPIYPEWPVASLPHVPQDIAREVQSALLAAGNHLRVAQAYEQCLAALGQEQCDSLSFPFEFDYDAKCETTKPLATLALEASKVGKWAGFRTTRSYFELRTMQEEAGLIAKDEKGNWKCTRASTIYDAIKCPEGHFKRSRKAFNQSCNQAGLPCKEGYSCFCRPCVKAFEVDVYDYVYGEEDLRLSEEYVGEVKGGCEKMSRCGVVEQTKTLTLRAFDNMARPAVNITAVMHVGDNVKGQSVEMTKFLPVRRIPNTFAFEFNLTSNNIGFEIIEIFANGIQISESPIRVQVIERNCAFDYHGAGRVPNQLGMCVCRSSAKEVGGRCVSSTIIFSLISAAVLSVALYISFLYFNYKKREADNIWLVSIDELHFSEPVDIIGQGSFGVVLLAEYRGTKVAVKRVLPQREKNRNESPYSSDGKNSVDANNSVEPVEESSDSKESLDLEAQDASHAMFRFDRGGSGILGRWGPPPRSIWGRRLANWFPRQFDESITMYKNTSILLSTSFSSSRRRTGLFGFCDDYNQQKRDFILEMRLLSRLRHPCITTVMGAVISPLTEPMLVMEYMEYGSLYDLLRNETMHTGGDVILQIVSDIVHGLRYLHASKPPILHGDLKAKNILVDSRFRAKVADFGLSTKTNNGIHGTPYWMAPEYLRWKTEYNSCCDIYSLGMVLYEIYARKTPYEGEKENPRVILARVCNPRINKRPAVPDTCPPKMAEIMKKCWNPDPFFRPSAQDLDLMFMETNSSDVEPVAKDQQGKNMEGKERTSTDTLYQVFPRHIADALNAGKKVEPESHEMVTVIFSDIIGFTDISREISALKVSNMLDRLYVAFDHLANKHDVFKVETIGDAYMGVTNLSGRQDEDHAKRIAEFALDLVETAGTVVIDEDDPDRGHIELRVGFHSGPVVSNVIGSLNPRYGLFGDTVNTASRMEANSAASRILCSEHSALLLKKQAPEIPLNRRGKIAVKGKGSMVTYWVGDIGDTDPAHKNELIAGREKQVLFDVDNVGKDEKVASGKKRWSLKYAQSDSPPQEMIPSIEFKASNVTEEVELEKVDSSNNEEVDHNLSQLHISANHNPDTEKEVLETSFLVDWIVEILLDPIKKMIAARQVTSAADSYVYQDDSHIQRQSKGSYVPKAGAAIIRMPSFDTKMAAAIHDFASIEVHPRIVTALKELVILIASMYNKKNHFHNFEHCCHVTMSMHKLLQYVLTVPSEEIWTTDQLALIKKGKGKDCSSLSPSPIDLHESSYGISSDPMAQFALVFAALIHDVDHRGVPNARLIVERPDLASRYNNRSVAEQNSFDVAWEILMLEQFKTLRRCMFGSHEEGLERFRQLVLKMILATDIFDKDSKESLNRRWEGAFPKATTESPADIRRYQVHAVSSLASLAPLPSKGTTSDIQSNRANSIMEHIMQVSDIAHTMQDWKVYQKWSKALFMETMTSHRAGRVVNAGSNPAAKWYEGELSFFDGYVIPLAKKMVDCKLFGIHSEQCLQYALKNRSQWAMQGRDIVIDMVEAYSSSLKGNCKRERDNEEEKKTFS